MSASVARSEKILNRVAAQHGLTDPAIEWLKTTLDPFHDNPLNCTGVPDDKLGNSVVQTIKSSVTLGCPPGITTGTWDCHVQMEPFFANSATPLSFLSYTQLGNGNAFSMNLDQIGKRGVYPVNILSYPTGDVAGYSNPFNPAVGDTSHVTTVLALNGNYTDGDYRIVSQGFEVINTTSDLAIQGLCTVYRAPVPTIQNSTNVNTVLLDTNGTVVKGAGSCSIIPIDIPPQNINDALKLAGSKQWKAKEGCYVVAHINDCENSIENNSFIQPFISGAAGGNSWVGPLPINNTVLSELPLAFREVSWSPFDISGSFFTGLSLSTTLVVNWIVYVERFPSIQQSDLAVLAKPSPKFCPMAFELYQAIARDLPCGVPQKENGLGDWFRDAVSTVSDLVTPVMSMIPHPLAQAGAVMARTIGGMARREPEAPYIANPKERDQAFKPSKELAREERVVEKVVKREVKPFLKKSKMSVIPPHHKKVHKK
jgi:hypothetical protein